MTRSTRFGGVYLVYVAAGTNCRAFGGYGASVRVDRATGAQTLVSDFGNAAQGPLGTRPTDVVVDTDGSILVADSDGGSCSGGCGVVFRVEPVTGQRTPYRLTVYR